MGVDRRTAEQVYRTTVTAFNDRDWDGYRAGYAEDLAYWSPGFTASTRDEVISRFQRVVDAVPDVRLETTAFAYDEDSGVLMVEHDETGTMTGDFVTEFGTLPATGKPFHVRNACVISVGADGRATAMREYFDLQTFLRQMGFG